MTGTPFDPARKVMTWPEAARWRESLEGALVFTNGVFDLIHPGHVEVLAAARREGAALVVGLNSDDSVQRLKGPTRPVRGEADRAFVLAALEAVDVVVVFEQDTPLELIRHLRPAVVVKGGDYRRESIVGADEVETWGGRVIVVPLREGHSTTGTIDALRRGAV
ncbi:MAG: D-glycero-beta-D-manno-heptose 1-phosphate adenylyltransferase [Gemmatimonadaceae bacterium]